MWLAIIISKTKHMRRICVRHFVPRPLLTRSKVPNKVPELFQGPYRHSAGILFQPTVSCNRRQPNGRRRPACTLEGWFEALLCSCFSSYSNLVLRQAIRIEAFIFKYVRKWCFSFADRRRKTRTTTVVIIAKPMVVTATTTADHRAPQHGNTNLNPIVAAATDMKETIMIQFDASIVNLVEGKR